VKNMAKSRSAGAQQKSPKRRPVPRAAKRHARKRSTRLSPEKLNALVAEAIVDSHDRDEQLMGLFNIIEENLAVPFETSILGLPVVVASVEERDDRIIAICTRDGERQAICLLDLAIPSPPPSGAEWIEAYRHWSRF
jgi:hypothetical protein